MLGHEYQAIHSKLVIENRATVGGLPPIDFTRLHRSTRTKSGFVGVYVNGKGFRAMARTPQGGSAQVSIGTFATADLAAWARYLHHQKHGLPYGEIEEILDEKGGQTDYYRDFLRKSLGREPTDTELLAELEAARADTGGDPLPMLDPTVAKDYE